MYVYATVCGFGGLCIYVKKKQIDIEGLTSFNINNTLIELGTKHHCFISAPNNNSNR